METAAGVKPNAGSKAFARGQFNRPQGLLLPRGHLAPEIVEEIQHKGQRGLRLLP